MRRTRTELLRLLEPGLGQEAATALLEELETVDPDRLATKQDLAATEATLRNELASKDDLAALREEVGHRIDVLRVEMDGRFGQVDERFTAMSGQITGAKNEVLAAVRGEMIDAIANQTRTMQYTLAGAMVTVLAGAATLATFI